MKFAARPVNAISNQSRNNGSWSQRQIAYWQSDRVDGKTSRSKRISRSETWISWPLDVWPLRLEVAPLLPQLAQDYWQRNRAKRPELISLFLSEMMVYIVLWWLSLGAEWGLHPGCCWRGDQAEGVEYIATAEVWGKPAHRNRATIVTFRVATPRGVFWSTWIRPRRWCSNKA